MNTLDACPPTGPSAEILPEETEQGWEAGDVVAMSADLIVIGAKNADFEEESGAGAVWVFRLVEGEWTAEDFLRRHPTEGGPTESDVFGTSVAVNGDWLAIGVPNDDTGGSDVGCVMMYEFTGTTWEFRQKVLSADADSAEHFGFSVAIQGDVLVVGAPDVLVSGVHKGAVYVSKRNSSGWGVPIEYQPNAPGAGPRCGYAVAIDDDTIVAGAPWPEGTTGTGRAYVITRDGSDWDSGASIAELDPDDADPAGDKFGWSVAIDGDLIAVGAKDDEDPDGALGTVSLFRHCDSSWALEDQLVPCGDADGFDHRMGTSVAIERTQAFEWVIAGAPEGCVTCNVPGTGAALAYRHVAGGWIGTNRFVAAETAFDDDGGRSVSVSGSAVVSGVPKHDETGATNLGLVAIFTLDSCETDLDGDGEIAASDLAVLLGAWGACDACGFCVADLDEDADIDSADLAILLGAWGSCVPTFMMSSMAFGSGPDLDSAAAALGFAGAADLIGWLGTADDEQGLNVGTFLLSQLASGTGESS